MAPFEALYGRKCRTPLFWNQTGETQVFGTDVLRHAEQQVRTIRDNLRVAQSRQKSYADTRRRELAFEVGDYVYLKVSPMRSVKRFNMKGKLAPRYVGPFKVLGRHGEVAYQLELPESLSGVCTMCSMCRNLRSVCVYLRSNYHWKNFLLKVISLMNSIRSEYWRQLRESPEVGSSECAKCSGIGIRKQRQPGKERMI